RIGAIGATGLFLSLGLRYVALLALPQADRLAVLVCMPAVGRWSMVLGAWSAPYGRAEGGLGQAFLDHLSVREILIATLIVIGGGLWSLGVIATGMTLAMCGALAVGWVLFCKRAFGGMTGDTLGALNELAEISFLLAGPTLLTWR